jgi:hypothetical protein
MKNFNYVMVLATLFASIVSTHALPVGDGVMMRVPDPTGMFSWPKIILSNVSRYYQEGVI